MCFSLKKTVACFFKGMLQCYSTKTYTFELLSMFCLLAHYDVSILFSVWRAPLLSMHNLLFVFFVVQHLSIEVLNSVCGGWWEQLSHKTAHTLIRFVEEQAYSWSRGFWCSHCAYCEQIPPSLFSIVLQFWFFYLSISFFFFFFEIFLDPYIVACVWFKGKRRSDFVFHANV